MGVAQSSNVTPWMKIMKLRATVSNETIPLLGSASKYAHVVLFGQTLKAVLAANGLQAMPESYFCCCWSSRLYTSATGWPGVSTNAGKAQR
eukprot:4444896-Prymnesium_polylepis.1